MQNTFENSLLARYENLPSQSDVLARFRELILAGPEEAELVPAEKAEEPTPDAEAVEAAPDEENIVAAPDEEPDNPAAEEQIAAEQEIDTAEAGSEDTSQIPDNDTPEDQEAADNIEDELTESETTEDDS